VRTQVSYTAIVFDLDGTLVETELCWQRAVAAMFERHGQTFGSDEIQSLKGLPAESAVRILVSRSDRRLKISALTDELNQLASIELSRAARLMPGAGELLNSVRSSYLVGVATNSIRSQAERMLDQLEIRVDALACGDEVSSPKPEPCVYHLACQRLGVATAEALAIEDSIPGLLAARSAGLATIAVSRDKDVRLRGDWAYDKISDTSLARLLNRLSRVDS